VSNPVEVVLIQFPSFCDTFGSHFAGDDTNSPGSGLTRGIDCRRSAVGGSSDFRRRVGYVTKGTRAPVANSIGSQMMPARCQRRQNQGVGVELDRRFGLIPPYS
jgi:hypothetical protein